MNGILNNKNQISQEAMKELEIKRETYKNLAKKIKELEKQIREALDNGKKPAPGNLICSIREITRRTPKYKQELAKRITKEEMEAIIENTPISITRSVVISLTPRNI